MRLLRSFRALPRAAQWLLLNQLALNLGFFMLLPYLSGYLSHTLAFSIWIVGLVLGLRTFSQQGLPALGGTLANHLGYTPVIATGCALHMAGFMLFGCAGTLPLVLLAALLSGLGGALFAPAVRASLASAAGEQRVEAFALFGVSEALGACLGPLLGSVLLQGNSRLVCLVTSGVFLVLTLLQIHYLPSAVGASPEAAGARSVAAAWREVLRNHPFMVFALAIVAYLTLYNRLGARHN